MNDARNYPSDLVRGDQQLLQRLLDGELSPEATATLEARLLAEPALRAGLERERGLRAGFVAGRPTAMAAPAGFAAGVMAAVRRQPSRRELVAEQAAVDLGQMCRRILIAAAILIAVGLAWHSGLFAGRAHDQLQAAPDEIRHEMERLDALIQAQPQGSPASPERR